MFALIGWAKADWLHSVHHLDIGLTEFENLAAWYQRVLSRPAVQAALKAEGLLPEGK
ncbi:hypothetical protein [Paracandidimonas soli]|uniref:hypothetical protein n=1 Tax=Paracandidimonas soli TaxID=1917182 RepID=UPI003340EDE7